MKNQEKIEKLHETLTMMGIDGVFNESGDAHAYGDYLARPLTGNHELRIGLTEDGDWRAEVIDVEECDVLAESEPGAAALRWFLNKAAQGMHLG